MKGYTLKIYSYLINILFFKRRYVWWPITANQKKIKIKKKKKNQNKKIEKMKKMLFRKKPHKIIMAYECQV